MGKIHSSPKKFTGNMFSNLYAPVFVKHLGLGSTSPWSQRNDERSKTIFHDFSSSGLCGILFDFYRSHSYFLKTKTTQVSKAHTSVLFRKIIWILRPFFSGGYEGGSKGSLENFSKCGSWVTLLGIWRMIRRMFSLGIVSKRSVPLSTFGKCLIQIFSAQWREDMRKTPNVIVECFSVFGTK